MYRLLIVEDEQIHREGLYNIISKLRPEYTIFQSSDGNKALKFLSEEHIDIMITDIHMPNMDGFELIANLKNIASHIKIIILTGYDYFEYARKALDLGAFQYLLKPIDEHVILNLLEKTENAILADREKDIKANNKIFDFIRPKYIENCITEAIEGNNTAISETRDELPNLDTGYFALLYCEDSNQINNHNKILITNKFQDNDDILIINIKKDVYMMGIFIFCDTIENKSIKDYLEDFIIKTQKELNINLYSCLIKCDNSIFDNLQKNYNKALRLYDDNFYKNVLILTKYDEDTHVFNIEPLDTDNIFKLIVQDKINDCIDFILSYFNKIQKERPKPIKRLKFRIIHSLQRVLLDLSRQYNQTSPIDLADKIEQNIKNCNSLTQMKFTSVSLLKEIANLGKEWSEDIYRNRIKECVNFLNQNYFDPSINMEETASKFYFHPTYFSSWFKKHTGMNFTNYLNKIRIEKSKDLLLKNVKIYTISKNVGYNDAKYYNRVFKKITGLTPSQYRKQQLKTKKD